jgi:hypothetical protein
MIFVYIEVKVFAAVGNIQSMAAAKLHTKPL